VGEVSGEDIERLAARVAMLVSDDGEADNAGRAVGQLARRLGLSGGDLKAMLLAGAGAGFQPGSDPARLKLEREIDRLRQELRAVQEAARSAQQDRNAMMEQVGGMRLAFHRRRAGARLRWLVAGLGVLGVVVVGAAVALISPEVLPAMTPSLSGPRLEAPARGARVALVRAGGASLRREPEPGSEVVAKVPAGHRLLVLRMEWRSLMQWALVEVDGRPGFVVVTELEVF
jgi:hypothetical protein